MAFSDWETVAASNSTTLGVNIAEGCPAANINNALREIMAQTRSAIHPTLDAFLSSTSLSSARSALGVSGGSTSSNNFGALTNTANKVPYMTGSDNWATADFTSFGRSLVATGNAAAALALLGISSGGGSSSISASGGYIVLPFGSTNFKFVWVDGTAAGETSTSISYPSAFSSWSRAICTGGTSSPTAEQNNPFVASTSTTAANIYNSRAASIPVTILAWGV